MQAIDYSNSFQKLRSIPCRKELVEAATVREECPHNAYIIFDHTAPPEFYFPLTLQALTHPHCNNRLILPELCLDYFDEVDKRTRKASRGAQQLDELDCAEHYVTRALGSDLKKVLQDIEKYNITLQRVDQYDQELIRHHSMKKNGFDNRLYAACASHYKKLTGDEKMEDVFLVTADTSLKNFVKEIKLDVKVCEHSQLLTFKKK